MPVTGTTTLPQPVIIHRAWMLRVALEVAPPETLMENVASKTRVMTDPPFDGSESAEIRNRHETNALRAPSKIAVFGVCNSPS